MKEPLMPKDHPWLRAYMAGIFVPTLFLLVVLASLLGAHLSGNLTPGAERAAIFPMAVVPNVWGVWNLLYLRLRLRSRISIGAFGALLPLLLVPAGLALGRQFELDFYRPAHAAVALPFVMAIYYLAWKYGVGPLNRIVGLP
jgi:hypothetical protein